ncbi:MAG: AAA family ATPase [Candidatus Thermoplasmatota archaeon]|nr:AAA family ATPase [Candidatus Thermoplasmatota archaeon]
MIIREIRLKNIRSHSDTVVGMREGINLIHGDIGAGKSSVLYAIEFALFGTGSRFGKNDIKLLRAGERSGFVEVRLDVEGRDYAFHREIKDGYDKGGWVVEDGLRSSLSAVELRRRALEALKLREPKSSRSRSYIYEYAIFTPQEEMKKILEDRPEDRMKLLRKAFGLTDYANARDNAGIITKAFESESKGLKQQIDEMQPRREELSAAVKELDSMREEEKKVSAELDVTKRKDEEMRKRIAEWESREKELQDTRMKLQGVRDEIAHLRSDIERLERDLVRIRDLREGLAALEKDYARYAELDRIINEERSKKAERDGYESRAKDLESSIKALEEEIEEHRKEISREKEIDQRIEALKREVDPSVAEERWRKNTEEKTSVAKDLELLEKKLKDLDREERGYRELSGQKVCPKCGQELTEEHVRNLISKIEEERSDIVRGRDELLARRSGLEREGKIIEEERRRIDGLNRELQSAVAEKNRIELHKKALSDKEKKRRALEAERSVVCAKRDSITVTDIATLETERKGLKSRYDEYIRARGEVERDKELKEEQDSKRGKVIVLADEEKALEEKAGVLEPVSEELRTMRSEREAVVRELSSQGERLKNVRELVKRQEEEIKRLGEEIRKLEAKEERRKRLDDAARWLTDFAEKVEMIEKNVVNFLNQEFQTKFQELFSLLIDGGEISVEVDEGFTPVIRENGMDINLSSLSGGERTSVAMAYRLALNRTVQRESSGMEESTIILDEPTDGFSAEQIEQFGELLRVIGCRQVILVSHEQELEGCADHVVRIVKENGISRII